MKTFEEKLILVEAELLNSEHWKAEDVKQLVKKWRDNNQSMISDSRIDSQFENCYKSIEAG